MSLITWLSQLCTDNMVTVTADYFFLFLVPNLSYHQSGIIFCSLGTYGVILVFISYMTVFLPWLLSCVQFILRWSLLSAHHTIYYHIITDVNSPLIYKMGHTMDHKFVNFIYDEVERCSTYQNVQFCIWRVTKAPCGHVGFHLCIWLWISGKSVNRDQTCLFDHWLMHAGCMLQIKRLTSGGHSLLSTANQIIGVTNTLLLACMPKRFSYGMG